MDLRKRNILVFRTAQDRIMAKLFDRLDQTSVVCLCQEGCLSRYERCYPSIKFISIHQDHFDYKDFINSVNMGQKECSFRDIYLPSSSKSFISYCEVLRICNLFSYNNLYLYDCEDEIIKISNHLWDRLEQGGLRAFARVFRVYYRTMRRLHIL